MRIVAGLFLIAGCLAQTPDVSLQTSTAEFRLGAFGYVAGSLLQDGRRLTLDEGAEEPGDRIWADGKPLPAAPYDLSNARRSNFRERGIAGERIQVRASVPLGPGAALEKVLTV